MEISDLVKKAHNAAVAKGFYPQGIKKNIGELLMLIVSELGEALEADRMKRHSKKRWRLISGKIAKVTDLDHIDFRNEVKDTFEDELADTVIRIADLCGYMGIDLESHIIAKMAYNETRPAKHGKTY